MNFSKRKFLSLPLEQQHKKCADLLRIAYEQNTPLAGYEELLVWMGLPAFSSTDLKLIADRYHWHLSLSNRSLKEHNLLPPLRKGDHEAKAPFLPIVIYLDNIRSAYNVGSILRTCEALRIGSVYFSEKTPFRDHEKVQHTAMGAASHVSCFQNVPLKDLPRPIIALDTSEAATPINEFLFPTVCTLVLGNEEYGISDESLALSDFLVEIPLFGIKNSLNVACAFAIAASRIRNLI